MKNILITTQHRGVFFAQSSSKIGSPANVDVMHDITAVFSVSDKAAEKWTLAK